MVLLLAILGQGGSVGEERLRDLAAQRALLDEAVMGPERYSWYVRIGAMPEGQTSSAFYPLGVGSRRYVLMIEGTGAKYLIRESFHGKVAKVDWGVELVDGAARVRPSGTLWRVIQSEELHVKRVGRLTAGELASLQAVRPFAEYGPGDAFSESLVAYFVKPNGQPEVPDQYTPDPRKVAGPRRFFPLVKEEVLALGWGKSRWHGPGSFDIGVPAWFEKK